MAERLVKEEVLEIEGRAECYLYEQLFDRLLTSDEPLINRNNDHLNEDIGNDEGDYKCERKTT